MDAYYLALYQARRAERDAELKSRHHHRLPRRPKGRFGLRRPATS
jgi:hypothetical protein